MKKHKKTNDSQLANSQVVNLQRADNHNPAAGIALIIVILLVIFGGVLYWMYSVKLLILPDSVAVLFGIGDRGPDESLPWDTGELSRVVKNGKSSDRIELTFEVNYENLHAALMNESEPEGFYQQLRICYYDKEIEIPRRVILKRNGEKFRIEKYAAAAPLSQDTVNMLETLIIGDDTTLYYRDGISGDSRSIPRGEGITPESVAGLPSVDDLLAIIAVIPVSDDSTFETDSTIETEEVDHEELIAPRYSDCELTMLRTDREIVYYAAFNDNSLGLHEEYYISLEYRVLISHRTFSGDKIIYSCETLSFSTNPSLYTDETDYTPIQK